MCKLVTADLKQPRRQHAIAHAQNERSAGQSCCALKVSATPVLVRINTASTKNSEGGSRSVFDKYELKSTVQGSGSGI